MNYRFTFTWIGLVAIALLGTDSVSAAHFEECAFNTGTNATLVIQPTASLLVDGEPIDVGDEIAAFTTDGVCAGAGRWEGQTLAFAVWGDDVVTPEKDGFLVGEPLTFRVWDESASLEIGTSLSQEEVSFSDARAHYTAHGLYVENGIFVISSLQFTRSSEDPDFRKAVSTERQVPAGSSVTLEQNYPNPFNPSTTLSYMLERNTHVRLQVMNVLGQTVRVLVDGEQTAGNHLVSVSLDDMPSGIYLYRVETPEASVTRTMMLSK